MIYKATQSFPDSERFGLVSQMRRAAVSVPANVVEGFKRRSYQDKLRLYNIAEASLEELRYFLLLAKDLAFLQDNQPFLDQQSGGYSIASSKASNRTTSPPNPNPES
jgi:four helix bundle protein